MTRPKVSARLFLIRWSKAIQATCAFPNELRQAMENEDISRMRQNSETLEQMAHSLSQQIYAAQPEGGPSGPEGQEGPDDDDTVEGEFREV